MANRTDSDEQAHGDNPLFLTSLLDCEECGEPYQGFWSDPSPTIEDMTEIPVAEQVCPACGHCKVEEWPGWMFRSEAG